MFWINVFFLVIFCSPLLGLCSRFRQTPGYHASAHHVNNFKVNSETKYYLIYRYLSNSQNCWCEKLARASAYPVRSGESAHSSISQEWAVILDLLHGVQRDRMEIDACSDSQVVSACESRRAGAGEDFLNACLDATMSQFHSA